MSGSCELCKTHYLQGCFECKNGDGFVPITEQWVSLVLQNWQIYSLWSNEDINYLKVKFPKLKTKIGLVL